MNRRRFIRNSSILMTGASLGTLPSFISAKTHTTKISILHTNDWHSRIEPFGKDVGNYAGMGGAAIRSKLIQKIRQKSEHVLLLDAGDIFQGTPYFNFYGGELEFKLMSMMQYDAVTLGNHDFDNGIDGLIKHMHLASFSFINCNYDFSHTALEDKVAPFRIFNKGPIRVGVIGVGIELEGLVPEKLYGNIQYHDPVAAANEYAYKLKHEHDCHLIICLSHLGYSYDSEKVSDLHLAQNSSYIDLIIGGHTHTFLSKPTVLINKLGKDVLINQVGWAGLQLGHIEYNFNPINKSVEFTSSSPVNILPESM